MIGDFLRGAEVVALVPGEDVDGQCDGFVVPERVFFEVVATGVSWLAYKADGFVADGLGNRDEGAGFMDVVDGAAQSASVWRRAAFPSQVVAIPAVKREAAAKLAFLAGVFVFIPAGAGFWARAVVGFGKFVEATSEGVVAEVDGEARIAEVNQAIE